VDNLIARLAAKSEVCVAGMMSGTSADGADVAIVRIGNRHIQVVVFDVFPYPPALRSEILNLCQPELARLDRIAHCSFVLGEVFAEALVKLCRARSIPLRSIDLIGSHGQTIYHNGQGSRFGRRTIRSTLQIGEPCVIAQRTGITTVADFRPRDIAAHGQGAPLVPYADYVLFRHRRLSRAIQNIGGIANVTFLPGGCTKDDVVAFDTGPGNMVIDGLMRLITKGKRQYDRNGAMAAKGAVDGQLLREMLQHPFLRCRPPKSTGREQFGQPYCQWFYHRACKRGLAPEQMVATATAFTASSIALAYRKFLPARVDEMILCGGGAHNKTLLQMLQQELRDIRILSTDEFGISVDGKEAVCFAVLAWATIKGIANNIPQATGAEKAVVLGKIIPA